MTAKQNQRGHEMYYNETKQEWLYSDNNSSINIDRPCIKCNHLPTNLGHDYCLKELSNCKFITNACCGHGINDDAYILLKDGRRFVLDKRISNM